MGVAVMDDPATMIAAALAAGAAAGVSSTASTAVRDAYAGLLAAVRRLLGRGRADVVDAHAADPSGRHEELVAALTSADARQDEAVCQAAARMLELVDPTGARAGKYTVDARSAKGVQIGDHNVQHNNFS
jgi:hypothetical protein